MDFESLPDVLKVKEVAKLLRCNGSHVKRLIEAGRLKVAFDVRTTGKHHEYRIPKKSVMEFMNIDNEFPKVEPVKPEPIDEASTAKFPKILRPKNRINLLGDLAEMKRKSME